MPRTRGRSVKQIKNKVLRDRGVVQVREKGKYTKYRYLPDSDLEPLKTPTMRLLEIQHGKRIEDMLLVGNGTEVAKRLAIDKGTVSKWKKRLGLRPVGFEMPDCNTCQEARLACLLGICWKLVDAEEWDLVEEKRKEILNES